MLLGIDVGGTFTDAVIVGGGRVLAKAKAPTTQPRLLDGVLAALDAALAGCHPAGLKRVALSTTIVTNTVVEGKADRPRLLLMSGPGLAVTGLVPAEPYILSGYVDHRGREVVSPAAAQVEAVCSGFAADEVFAVAGKFAVRNPGPELKVAQWLERYARPAHVTMGAALSGSLNFVRRANSAYYNAAVWRQFGRFAAAVREALAGRGITAPVYILKADGGTMPLDAAGERPVETVFTGPAASVLGVQAVAAPAGEALSLDIGGTTTDIALWQDGRPLFAGRGARIEGYPTAVRSFWVKSVGVGGDSHVRREAGQLAVGPGRLGPAMAAGGPAPTVSDAVIAAGRAAFGDRSKAVEAMRQVAAPGKSPADTAEEVLAAAAAKICAAVRQMIEERAAEPVYRVEDIVSGVRPHPRTVVGVGGAAGALAPLVAAQLGLACDVPADATVANAIGAALARPTLEITLRADTAQGYYTVAELGLRAALDDRRLSLADAETLAARHLADRASQAGIAARDVETVFAEEFSLVRGFATTGKIISCRLQIKPGVCSGPDEEGA